MLRLDVFERSAGTTTQVSTNTAGNANATIDAWFAGASADGSKVFFWTTESMAANDTDAGVLTSSSAPATRLPWFRSAIRPAGAQRSSRNARRQHNKEKLKKCKKKANKLPV